MSLIQFLRILASRWKMIIGTMLACMAAATIVASLLPKRYPASARVLLDIIRPDPVTGESVGGRDARAFVNTQVQLIQDLRVAGAVVDRLGLANDPATIAMYEASGRSAADGGLRAWLGQQIIDSTSANLISNSNILEITYQSTSPERSKQIVTVIRDAYVDSALRLRTDSATRTGDWFREQADKERQSLSTAEANLSAFMEKNDLVLIAGIDGDTAKLTQLQSALQSARGQQSTADAAVAGRMANDPVVDQLQVSLATVEDELALAGARLGTQHPTYKAIRARRDTMAGQVNMARSKSQAGIAALTGAARSSVTQLEAQVAAQEQVVMQRKPVLDELTRLYREVDMRRQQYEKAAARTAELRLEADAAETGLVILGDPTSSSKPSYPKVPLIIGLSTFFGLALGTLAAIIAEFIARRVRGPEDMAHATGAPVLVTVGAAPPSPLRQRLQKLFGRSNTPEGEPDMQAI